jgi:hypothetical protein
MHIRLLTLDPSCLSEDEFDSDFGLSEHEEEVDEEALEKAIQQEEREERKKQRKNVYVDPGAQAEPKEPKERKPKKSSTAGRSTSVLTGDSADATHVDSVRSLRQRTMEKTIKQQAITDRRRAERALQKSERTPKEVEVELTQEERLAAAVETERLNTLDLKRLQEDEEEMRRIVIPTKKVMAGPKLSFKSSRENGDQWIMVDFDPLSVCKQSETTSKSPAGRIKHLASGKTFNSLAEYRSAVQLES